MTNRYKELPAFETNEFKVGDLVRVYRPDGNITDSIIRRKDEYVPDVWHFNKGYEAHFKQCRKLEEIKPREFWLVQGKHDRLLYADTITFKPVIKDHEKLIKVREVIE